MARGKPVTIRSIEANRGDINEFADELEKIARSFSRLVQKEIIRALGENQDSILAADAAPDIRKTGVNADANKTDELLTRILEMQKKNFLGKYNTRISRLVSKYVQKTHRSVNNAQQSAFKAAGIDLHDQRGIDDLGKANPAATKNKARHAVTLSENVHKFLSSQMNKLKLIAVGTVTTGGSLADLKERYREKDSVGTICQQIAENTGHFMTAEIQQENAAILGCEQGIWVHRPGAWSSRKTHRAMDGRKFDLSKGMWDPEVQLYVQPGQLPNCRCTFRMIFPFEKDK